MESMQFIMAYIRDHVDKQATLDGKLELLTEIFVFTEDLRDELVRAEPEPAQQ